MRMLHLLLIIAVLWCGLHVAEGDAALAQPAFGQQIAEVACDATPEPVPHVPHVSDHHCPMAPDLDFGWHGAQIAPSDGPLFTRPAAPLVSFSQAPPLEPPAA